MSFPETTFKKLYPQLADEDSDFISAIAEEARCFVGQSCGAACTDSVWMAVVAHMLSLHKSAQGGGAAGKVASARIGRVSIGFQATASSGSWSDWLGMTPYGVKAMALMKKCSSGGAYGGGMPERDAFRSVYGVRGGFR